MTLQDENGYFEPTIHTLPPGLSPEERAKVLGVLRDIQMELDEIFEESYIGTQDQESADKQFMRMADDFNRDPERVRAYAELQTGIQVRSALMIYDGIDDDGNARFSFSIEPVVKHHPDSDPED